MALPFVFSFVSAFSIVNVLFPSTSCLESIYMFWRYRFLTETYEGLVPFWNLLLPELLKPV